MPKNYQRGYNKYKTKYRNYKRQYGRWNTYKKAGSQLYKDVMFLKSIVNAEKKFIDTTNSYSPSNVGTQNTIWLSNIAQNVTEQGRIGNSIKAASVQMRLTVQSNASAAQSFVRAIIFSVNEQPFTGATTGALPQVNDVLATPFVQSPLNMSNAKFYNIHSDRLITLNNNAQSTKQVTMFKKLTHHIRWDATNGNGISFADKGHLFLLLLSDQATNIPLVGYYSRIRFYDN